MAKTTKTPALDPKYVETVNALFQDLRAKAPKVFDAIKGEAIGVMTGPHLEAIKAVLRKVGGDVIDLQSKKINQETFEARLAERKEEIFSFFMTDKVSRCKPSDQKILDSSARVMGILKKSKDLL